jgi:Ca2+-binding RTX toxin-like protein
VALDGVAEIQGGAGADAITGSAGNDVIDGGNDGDTVHGGAGNDVIIGGRVSGNSGNDLLYGDDGDDTFLFFVNPQVDPYYGGNGWDKIQAGQAGARLNIGLGPSVSATLQVEEISAGGFSGVSLALQDRYNGSGWTGQALDLSAVKLTGIAYVAGTLGSDSIITGGDDDTILGGDGADVIQTGGGADTLSGDAGADTLRGGAGADTLIGGAGDDTTFGDDGDDVFSFPGAGLGYDAVTGGAGVDVITALANGTVIGLRGFSEIETITAGGFTGVSILDSAGADVLDFSTVTVVSISTFNAGAGADLLTGTSGADTILDGDGDDVFRFGGTGLGTDTINGGLGYDSLVATANGTVIGVGALSGIEAISGGGFTGVSLAGSTVADLWDFSGVALSGIGLIDGGSGNDNITGTGEADVLQGSAGDDILNGGAGDDTFLYTAAANGLDTVSGGLGYDVLKATAAGAVIGLASFSGLEAITANGFASVSVGGTTVADVLDFSAVTLTGIVKIDGAAGNDTITGSAGDDIIYGGFGLDTIYAGGGNDTIGVVAIEAGQNADFLVDGGSGFDTVVAVQTGGIYMLGFTGIEAFSNNGFANVYICGWTNGAETFDFSNATLTGISYITGQGGNDTIIGSAGADKIMLSLGQDVLTGGGGADIFFVETTTDSTVGAAHDVITDFLAGTDHIDLTTLDARTNVSGNQAFTFVGGAAFSNVSGELRADYADPLHTMIYGDVNGDGLADFAIELAGLVSLSSTDFFL